MKMTFLGDNKHFFSSICISLFIFVLVIRYDSELKINQFDKTVFAKLYNSAVIFSSLKD